ncbi:alpha-glucosidase [Bacillus sp. RO2]|uniref:alpha-glucosidase n=1 Tax=Bacillus sp. RO2 TaxID=2723913 RepID=UPI00197C3BF5|nr:alpha-glucosidase [Bacillus sp. RO2]
MAVFTENKMMQVVTENNSITVTWKGEEIFQHSPDAPFLFVGKGQENVKMFRGNFDIKDYVTERMALPFITVRNENDSIEIDFASYPSGPSVVTVQLHQNANEVKLEFVEANKDINRFWIRLKANKEEKVYGCGEQLTHFNMRGKNFPLWTSEPGVGRNKSTYVTWQSDVTGMAGGDYYHTNYPQPTFVSSRKYYCHVETTAYADFDFRNDSFHELQIWEMPKEIVLEGANDFLGLLEKITDRFGRQPELPEWTYNGIWLGIQGGTDVVEEKLEKALAKGVKVGGVWCQDWQGIRMTSFGKRLMWNWQWNPDVYPNLDTKIHEWKEKGIRFLGYINPYVAEEGNLFATAKEKGYLALNDENEVYLVDFGEFYCGVVDFTNPDATEWYKSVIQDNLIGFGLDGWMADFGEYLPTDVKLHSGEDPMKMHNAWPTMWAKVNYEAVEEAGKLGDVVYFMRAGYTGIQKYNTLLWGGDQSVDFTLDDGLASVIPAALSAGMLGNGLHHSDIGGYTSLFGNKRNEELLLRWTELGAFTPVMRSHEGNRPYDCFQFDDTDRSLEQLAKMTTVYTTLAPYTKSLVKQNSEKGTPVQRPLFMHYENDESAYDIQYQYLYGKDLLVAPVYEEGATTWDVYLPEDEWVHVWSGKEYAGGDITVNAPIGEPPVFYRKNSEWADLFDKLKDIK